MRSTRKPQEGRRWWEALSAEFALLPLPSMQRKGRCATNSSPPHSTIRVTRALPEALMEKRENSDCAEAMKTTQALRKRRL